MPVSKARKRWRLLKTLILAIVATVVLAWSAVESWGVDPEELWGFFISCLILLGVTALLGICGAGILVLLKRRKR